MHFAFVRLTWTTGPETVVMVRSSLDVEKAVKQLSERRGYRLADLARQVRNVGGDDSDLMDQALNAPKVVRHAIIGTTDNGYNGIFELSADGIDLATLSHVLRPAHLNGVL